MTGAHGGIIGVSYESGIPKFLTGLPTKFEPSESLPMFNGVIIEIDEVSGLAMSITRINMPVEVGT
ncbi:MAG: YmdB family metallophosphoesterase, partial [Synergistaceae bacterium]|nr:YmdB family metallophosphoesterase [Synergistaceae bacterium]